MRALVVRTLPQGFERTVDLLRRLRQLLVLFVPSRPGLLLWKFQSEWLLRELVPDLLPASEGPVDFLRGVRRILVPFMHAESTLLLRELQDERLLQAQV